MKIEGQAWGRNPYVNAQTVETKQAGKFSDALAAQPRQDTLTISHRPPVEKTAPAQAEMVSVSEPMTSDAMAKLMNVAVEARRGYGYALDAFFRNVSVGESDAMIKSTAAAVNSYLPASPSAVQIKLKELREAAANADYAGMSYKEIYTTIWDRYNDAFGGNMPAITSGFGGSEWNDISYQFSREVRFMAELPMQREIKRDTGLEPGDKGYTEYRCSRYGSLYFIPDYEGMSVEEKEQAILEKYAGKDTLLDFLNMQGELHWSGVLGHKMGGKALSQYIWAIENQLNHSYFFDNMLTGTPVSQLQWNRALYGRFDVHSFAASLKERMQHLSFSGFDFDVAGAVTKGIDDLLAALERRDAA